MGLESDFPEDPTKPSLHYAVSTLMPLVIPWTNAPMRIGTPFLKCPDSTQFTFGQDRTAFSLESLSSIPLVYTQGCHGLMNQATESGPSHAHRSLSMDISVSVGGKFLGVSARGQHGKESNRDENLDKASVHSTIKCGKVTLAHFPKLSEDAILILGTSKDPRRDFSDRYGDYFVGGYILGGANSTVLWASGTSEASSERLKISFEVRALFVKVGGSITKQSSSSSISGMANMSAFDSLDASQKTVEARQYGEYMNAVEAAGQNRQRGVTLSKRVQGKMKALDLGPSGSELAWAHCDDLCRSGLVLELLMLPWAGLRDYRAALLKT